MPKSIAITCVNELSSLSNAMDSNYNSHKIKVSLTNNSLMHFSNQEKRAPQVGNPQRSRLPENKPHNYASHANHPARDYEDEQASLALKGTDSS